MAPPINADSMLYPPRLGIKRIKNNAVSENTKEGAKASLDSKTAPLNTPIAVPKTHDRYAPNSKPQMYLSLSGALDVGECVAGHYQIFSVPLFHSC